MVTISAQAQERLVIDKLRGTVAFHSQSASETQGFARALAPLLPGGTVLGLSGELGAGKTEFIRGFVQGLGISEQISSPTFVLETQYAVGDSAEVQSQGRRFSRGSFHHWDIYRLGAGTVPEDLREYCGNTDKIVAIEWHERAPQLQDLLSLRVQLDFVAPSVSGQTYQADERRIVLKADPKIWDESFFEDLAGSLRQR